MSRLQVLKTYKLFIAGQFPRSESGRYYQLTNAKKQLIANMCLASKKDFRNAVVAARAAQTPWFERTAFNRGQILYRIAEMLEGRRTQFIEELILQGESKAGATKEVNASIDRLVYYAGWCDKYQQIFSSVNPVASAHYNFSILEPMGLVAVIAPEETSLVGLVSVIAPIIAGGNTCVVLASEKRPLCAISLAEVIAHSDLPAGVVNCLTGLSSELHGHFSSHMDVNALVYCRTNRAELVAAKENCALNVKRFFHWQKNWNLETTQNPYLINDLQEVKTTWHPIEQIGASRAKY